MPQQIRLWSVDPKSGQLREASHEPLDLEQRLEEWLEHDISIISNDLMVIGRQVRTAHEGLIDLLCLNRDGDLVVVELKRDKTPRDVTAQAIDYASWAATLTAEDVIQRGQAYLGSSLQEAFQARFSDDLPETLNTSTLAFVVASSTDASTERIVRYLAGFGVGLNVVTFQHFRAEDGAELIGRTFLVEPDQLSDHAPKRRRRNLSFDDLQQAADENGVGDIYRKLAEGLSPPLSRGTTQSNLQLRARLDGNAGPIVVFNLLPGESDEAHGLHFQAYAVRLSRLMGVQPEEIRDALPTDVVDWAYAGSGDREYGGYAGYFRLVSEADAFVAFVGRPPLSDD